MTGAPTNAILYYDKESNSIRGCPFMSFNMDKSIINIKGDLNVSGNLDPVTIVLQPSSIMPSQPVSEENGQPYSCNMLWADKYSNFISTSYYRSDSGVEFDQYATALTPGVPYDGP